MSEKRVHNKGPKREKTTGVNENVCPECNSTAFEYDQSKGETICKTCGLVIDENMVDNGPEWMAFDHEQRYKCKRVGALAINTMHGQGLSITIDWNNNISPQNQIQVYRLKK